MNDFVIPFSLEQEASYREQILSLLEENDYYAEYRDKAGVLVNMTIFEIVKTVNEFGYNFIDNNRDALSTLADFCFLDCHMDIWFEDEEIKPIRLLIEEREKQLTGTVSNSYNSSPVFLPSKLLSNNDEDLDPDRQLTEEEMFQFFEDMTQEDADRLGVPVEDFKQMIYEQMVRKRKKSIRKKAKGFGKKNRRK